VHNRLYLHGDHLSSVSVVGRGACGQRRHIQTTQDFTGQLRDGTGLLFYNARYYDPALGRFANTHGVS